MSKRKIISQKVAGYRIEKTVEGYKEGQIDLNTAAKVAGLPLREIMMELEKEIQT